MWYVVDGMDGCGKSSAAEFIREQLEADGRKVLVLTHPNKDIEVGRKGAAWLLREGKLAKIIATQYYVRDILHSIRVMKRNDKLGNYDDIIFVRYIMAVSYLPRILCKPVYLMFKFLLPEPDVKFFIDTTAETAMARISSRGHALESFENLADLKKTREKMLMLVGDNWMVVENSGTHEESRKQILGYLRKVRQ